MLTGEAIENKEQEKPPVKAVIFDLDGLLIDSEPLWSEARNSILGEFGAELTAEDKAQTMGIGYREGLNYFIDRYNLPLTFEEFAQREQIILDKLYESKLAYKPGAAELIEKLKGTDILTAVATSAPRRRLEFALRKLSLDGFNALVTGDDIEKGKPDPEIFLKTAEKLDVDPKSCVVLEDSPFGIVAAKAANMYAVAVYDTRYMSKGEFLRRANPDLIVDSLSKLNLQKLQDVK